MINVLFASISKNWPVYEPLLRQGFEEEGLSVNLSDTLPPEDVDFIVYSPNGPVQDFGAFPRLKAVFNLWAGVERVVGNQTLKVPLYRMADTGLKDGMKEWVAGHVLRYHLGMETFLNGQDGIWRGEAYPPLAQDRTVGILGYGELGKTCADTLAGIGFDVAVWSRTAKSAPYPAYHGQDGLGDILKRSEIVVSLLPHTPQTEGLFCAATLNQMRQGAFILNGGRGGVIVEDDLLHAVQSGQIAGATLDVHHVEPLPPEHPFWAEPRITVTPHVSAVTRPNTAARSVVTGIKMVLDGKTPAGLVDRSAGY